MPAADFATLLRAGDVYLDSIGWAYFKDGKLDLALDHLKRAADMMTNNSVVQDHYADVLFRRPETAWQNLDRRFDALPVDTDAAARVAAARAPAA